MTNPEIEPAKLHADAHEERRSKFIRLPKVPDGDIITLRREEADRYLAKLGYVIDKARSP